MTNTNIFQYFEYGIHIYYIRVSFTEHYIGSQYEQQIIQRS